MEEIKYPILNERDIICSQSVVNCGLDNLVVWLRERLKGNDSHISLDKRTGEDPSYRIIHFLYKNENTDPGFILMSQAIVQLLEESKTHVITSELYWICINIKNTIFAEWFEKELLEFSKNPKYLKDFWSEYDFNNFMHAAANQNIEKYWEEIIKIPDYSTWALIGLGEINTENYFKYLNQWFSVVDKKESYIELQSIIKKIKNKYGKDTLYNYLDKYKEFFLSDLLDLITTLLKEVNLKDEFNNNMFTSDFVETI